MPGRIPLRVEATLTLTLITAYLAAAAYLCYRGHRSLLCALLPADLIACVFCLLDALVTLRGTYTRPWYEANPFTRVFLMRAGWPGLCAAFFVWVLGWTVFIDALETVRARLWDRYEVTSAIPLGRCVRAAQVYTVYAVAGGHLDGFASWTHMPSMAYWASTSLLVALRQHAVWTMPFYPLAYLLYPSLVFGAMLTLCHYAVRGTRYLMSPAAES